MAAAIMMPLSATAQTRIAVVSDIHVMAPSLLPNEAKTKDAWKNYYAGQRKMLEQSAGLFDQFVTTMISEAPDVLLITGDLTKDGELVSHQYVRGLQGENGKNEDSGLKKLEAAGIQVYVIPGNHDFGDEGNHTQFNADGSTGNAAVLPETEDDGFAKFYEGYGYGTGTTIDPNGSLSYVAEPIPNLVLLAIDSHSKATETVPAATISSETLNWLCTQAQNAKNQNKRVIAMMHHPLFPHITGANMFIDTYTVANYVDVRNALIDAGVNVILTGHFHTSDIAYDWKNSQTNGIYDINTGSLISYPCDYRMLTLSADKSTLSVKTKSLTPENWTADQCKLWLHERIASKTKTIMNNKISSLPSYMKPVAEELATEDVKDEIAQFSANLFILHAEGNENISEDREDIEYSYTEKKVTSYNILFTIAGINDASIYSILDDKSNYGNDHENQTADRAIVINLANPDPSNLLLELDNNDDNSSVINYYNGKEATVTLTGRTLYKDGFWNTICLPFNIANINAKDANDKPIWPLYGATIRQLDTESVPEGGEKTGIYTYDNYSKLYLYFSDPTTSIVAGVPYIVKWGSGSGEDITNPSFSGVTIDKTIRDASFTGGKFCGNYNYLQFDSDDTGKLLIGINTGMSTLFYPKANASLGACRAYFQLADDYTAGEPDTPGSGPSEIRNFVLNFGDDDSATGIIAIGDSQLSTLNAQRSEWFTLDGRRLAAKPTAKGLYIHAGRKVVIK